MSASIFFKEIFRKKSLISIYNEHLASSKAIGLDRVRPTQFQKVLSSEIDLIINRAKCNCYKFTSYKQKLISKGADKVPRVISIPTLRDRVTLRGLCNVLQKTYPELLNEIPQIKIQRLRDAFDAEIFDSFIKIDLSNFYASIPQDKLIENIRKKIRKREILSLIKQSITNPTTPEGARPTKVALSLGVPQGLAISNILAEIYIHEFDTKAQAIGSIFFTRYVDDILILCDSKVVESTGSRVIQMLKDIGLSPHELNGEKSKSYSGSLADSFDFLGYKILNNKLSIRKQSIHRFESALAKIFTTYRYHLSKAEDTTSKQRAIDICEWRLNLRISGCIFEGKRLGWGFYFSQLNDTSSLRTINSTLNSLLKRFSLLGKIKVKSLVKTFYETKRRDKNSHQYIINFDNMNLSEKKEILGKYLGAKSLIGYSDSKIERFFKMRIGAVVKELEKDISVPS